MILGTGRHPIAIPTMIALPLPTRSSSRETHPPATEEALLDSIIDAKLVQRFAKGDPTAFDEIVARHRGRIYGLTLNLLHNPADAEEITQDTFIRAWRGLGRFRG
jgi:RNA polymerase sigma-70 factor (ECF subfamily)